MLTLRGLPPAAHDHPDPLLDAYYRPLLAAWGGRDRATARLIDRYWVGLGADHSASRFGIPAGEWPICRGLVRAEGFVSMAARKGLHRMINPGAFPLGANRFKDKGFFAKAAAEANLPVPDSLTDARRTGEWLAAQEAVMVKPSFSSHGRGIERFRRANGGWHGSGGKEIGHGGFERLVRRTLEARGVIQAALATDASLVDISPGALPTLRLVTLRDEAEKPEIALRVLRVGGGSSPVDNFAFGGLAMEIDSDGRVGTAFARGPDSRPSATKRHPQTGARLAVTLHAKSSTAPMESRSRDMTRLARAIRDRLGHRPQRRRPGADRGQLEPRHQHHAAAPAPPALRRADRRAVPARADPRARGGVGRGTRGGKRRALAFRRPDAPFRRIDRARRELAR